MLRVNPSGRTRGFTLLEMLVVLVIVAATSAIVFPNLTALSSSVDFAFKRDGFERALNGIAYGVFRDNQDAILVGTYTDKGRVPDDNGTKKSAETTVQGNMRTRSLTANQREILPPILPFYPNLTLPEGWRIDVREPVYFHSSGFCDGGDLELTVGRTRYEYTLVPPLCRAVRVE